MGRLSKAAKKREDKRILKAVEQALSENKDSGRIVQLENTLSTIQQLIYAVLKPVPLKATDNLSRTPQIVKEVPSEFRNPLFDNLPDEPLNAVPAELDDGDDLGPGRWI